MTTADLIDRLAPGEGGDRELDAAIGRTLCPHLVVDDYLPFTVSRDACATLQEETLPGWYRSSDQDFQHAWLVTLTDTEWRDDHEGRHSTSECRAHLIAILRAKEAGHG
jgi:hypothetical protein